MCVDTGGEIQNHDRHAEAHTSLFSTQKVPVKDEAAVKDWILRYAEQSSEEEEEEEDKDKEKGGGNNLASRMEQEGKFDPVSGRA